MPRPKHQLSRAQEILLGVRDSVFGDVKYIEDVDVRPEAKPLAPPAGPEPPPPQVKREVTKPIPQRVKKAPEGKMVAGYYPTFNDLDDRLIPQLRIKPFEQAVLRCLWRLSRGYRQMTATIGYGGIAERCVMSREKARKTIMALLERGFIQVVGRDPKDDSTIYLVLSEYPAVPPRGIPQHGIPGCGTGGVPPVPGRGIPRGGSNKNNKGVLNTDVNTDEELDPRLIKARMEYED